MKIQYTVLYCTVKYSISYCNARACSVVLYTVLYVYATRTYIDNGGMLERAVDGNLGANAFDQTALDNLPLIDLH